MTKINPNAKSAEAHKSVAMALAAPAMYEALKEVLENEYYFYDPYYREENREIFKRCYAALIKAESF